MTYTVSPPTDSDLDAASITLRAWTIDCGRPAPIDAARTVAAAWIYGRESDCPVLARFVAGSAEAAEIGPNVAALRAEYRGAELDRIERAELRALADVALRAELDTYPAPDPATRVAGPAPTADEWAQRAALGPVCYRCGTDDPAADVMLRTALRPEGTTDDHEWCTDCCRVELDLGSAVSFEWWER